MVIVKNQRTGARGYGRNGRFACLPIPQVNLIDNLQSKTIDQASTRKPVNLYKQLMESQNVDLKRNKKIVTQKLMQHLHLYKGRQMASHTKSQTLDKQSAGIAGIPLKSVHQLNLERQSELQSTKDANIQTNLLVTPR